MDISIGQLIVWTVIGLLAGSLVGRLVKRSKKGFGWAGNLVLGMVGAVVGGLIFDIFDVRIGGDIVLTLSDFIAAFVGAFIVLGVMRLVR